MNDAALATQSVGFWEQSAQGAFFGPSTITKAGPLRAGRKGRRNRAHAPVDSLASNIAEGPCRSRRRGVSKVVSVAQRAQRQWLKVVNPVKAVAIEGIAHELGVDPIQLARKIIKYGSGLVPLVIRGL